MQILIAGVGYTGKRLLEAYPAVKGINRRPLQGIATERIQLHDFDEEVSQRLSIPAPYALLYTIPPPATGSTDTRLSNFLGSLTQAPARFVYLSTTGVYGDRQGRLTDESVPPSPVQARAVRRWEAEKSVLRYCGNCSCQPMILRVPGIYGPGRLNLSGTGSGQVFVREQDANPGNRIHVDDLIACSMAALLNDVLPGVYNVGDNDFTSSIGFARIIAEMAGLPAPLEVSRAEAEQSFSPGRLSYLLESRRIDTQKMREVLGVMPRYARLKDGVRASLTEDGFLNASG